MAGIVSFGVVERDDHYDFAEAHGAAGVPTFKIYSDRSESFITGKRIARKWIVAGLVKLQEKVKRRLAQIELYESRG